MGAPVTSCEAILAVANAANPDAWAKLAPYLQRALEHGGEAYWSIEDVLAQCLSGQVQCWALLRVNGDLFGAGISTRIDYPKRKVWEILLMGTDPHTEAEWAQCLEQFKAAARANGIDAITGTGRPGWARKIGASRSKIVWEIDL